MADKKKRSVAKPTPVSKKNTLDKSKIESKPVRSLLIRRIGMVIVVLAVFFFVRLMQRNNSATPQKEVTQTQQLQQSPEAPPVKHEEIDIGPSATFGAELTSLNHNFTISVPEGWNLINDTVFDYAQGIGLERITYVAGMPSVVEAGLGRRGPGVTTAAFSIHNYADQPGLLKLPDSAETLATTEGIVGRKVLLISDGSNVPGSEAGTKFYSYQFEKNGRITSATYVRGPNDPPQLKVVEDTLQTLKLP